MNTDTIVRKTEQFVKNKMSGEETGHDWLHVDRVRRSAVKIAKAEKKGDMLIIQLAALTHDLDDWKFRTDKNRIDVNKLLVSFGLPKDMANQVSEITENISFKLGTNPYKMKTWEGKIVQDADRLDAIGAIGIARLFAFGGKMGRQIHNPHQKLVRYKSLKNLNC